MIGTLGCETTKKLSLRPFESLTSESMHIHLWGEDTSGNQLRTSFGCFGKAGLRLMGFRKASEEKLPQNFPLVDEITVGRLAVAGLYTQYVNVIHIP
ncbi:hypothetical protein IV203_012129 [Nitzschia inconspicua]|uniref:Uncharacterized protein n=1 Tax=Nitzschia inconspicua TaxID=303405 RepID=A0A9K3KTL2_9STRA|nr:hypothetical protein IV203_012129 [Nitzschia inconspicua]